ncbi:MAG TPA: single-stranded DNA-binding protein [Pyrinomonadaceae bacterium]|nr:single-stranded DNA-binding protein [Pyrinomonadaceae bacterium]
MAASISILGNVGGNAELRYSNQGSAIASFSMASNSFKKTEQGKVQITEWYNVTAFGKLAETIAANVTKGTHLLVLGRLTFKPWMTKDGDPRAGAEVILQSFEFAGGNRNNGPEHYTEQAAEEPQYTGPAGNPPAAANGQSAIETTVVTDEPYVDQF